MKDRIIWGKEKRVYSPRIRQDRLQDLQAMREFTRRPITVLVDEALSIYLANFLTSSEYMAWCDQIERGIDELRDNRAFDTWDIGDYHNI